MEIQAGVRSHEIPSSSLTNHSCALLESIWVEVDRFGILNPISTTLYVREWLWRNLGINPKPNGPQARNNTLIDPGTAFDRDTHSGTVSDVSFVNDTLVNFRTVFDCDSLPFYD